MDCDRVFMVLTRGPFPTGESWDEEVEAHLETCGDCWRLAEALRPALEVFQEAVPPAESRDLPGYWGDARPAAAVLSQLERQTTRTARTALVPGAQRAAQSLAEHPDPLVSGERSVDIFRAVALAATMCAVVATLLSLLRG